MTRLDAEPVVLEGVETLQLLCEFESRLAEELLPPALHPTLPGVVGFVVQRFPASPWGAFHLAQVRVECRSGVRPRAFLLRAVADNPTAAAALTSGWGYRTMPGAIRLRRFYDQVEAGVEIDGALALFLRMRDPHPLRPEDVQYVAGMHPAQTPRGLRLVQVDPTFAVQRAERGEPDIAAFAGEAWGAAALEPSYPISASLSAATMTLPRLRFVCRLDLWAFDGTERV